MHERVVWTKVETWNEQWKEEDWVDKIDHILTLHNFLHIGILVEIKKKFTTHHDEWKVCTR